MSAGPHGTESAFLSLVKVSKWYGSNKVLTDISTDFQRGQSVALIGPSGGGKSTLLRCINWLTPISQGSIYLAGEKLGASSVNGGVIRPRDRDLLKLRRRIGMIFQNFNLFPHMTALDNIIFAQVHALKRPKVEARERGQQLLQRVGLGDKGDSKPPRLSGGQQQRVAIARALALEPEVMLVDEPTSAIDPELRVEVLKVLREVAESGMTMLIATHEMQFAKDVADHVLFLDGGRIAEEGASKQMLDAPQNDRTKQFLNAIREG